MQTAANPTSYYNTNTTPVLTNSGTWGSVPVIMDYWGSGAPPGISRARFVALHYEGFITSDRTWLHGMGTTSSAWLAFSGNGFIRVQINGADVLNTKLTYSTFNASTLFTPTTGDKIDIYYWQLGEPWGGLVGTYVPQKWGQTSATTQITNDQYREAPPLAASIIPFSVASATTLKEVTDAQVEINGPMETATLSFRVPLSNQDISTGWRLLQGPRRLQYTDVSGSVITLKRNQLIQFQGGFSQEQYYRFSGFILDFDEQEGLVTVQCAAIESKMSKVPVENYPDPISYCAFGYFKQISTSEPIFNITAYDNWPLEHAIKDLCLRGGVDPKLFYGKRQANNVERPLNQSPRIVLARKHNTPGGNPPSVAQIQNMGYNVSVVLSGTVTDYRAYDIVVVDVDAWSAGEFNQFIRDLLNDGQKVMVAGNDTSTDIFYVTSSTARAPVGTCVPLNITHPLVNGWSSIPDADSGFDITGVIDMARVLGQASNYAGDKMLIEINSGTGSILHMPRFALGTDSNRLVKNAIEYLCPFVVDVINETGNVQYYTRAKTISGDYLRLQRPTFYGNSGAGFDPNKPSDDEYIYRPNLADSVLDFARELADTLGYDFRTNPQGSVVLASRSNPHRYKKITASGTKKFSPSTLQGSYQESTSTVNETINVNGARIDLVTGREATLGTLNYSVSILNGPQVASGTINLALAGETTGIFFYDNRFTVQGANLTVFKLYSGNWGQYTVKLAQNAGSKWWLDSLLLYDYDSQSSALPQTLLTDFGISDLRTQSNAHEAVNKVVVIGKRKAVITDSAKLRNPNNPQQEFFVSAGSDPSSIWDSTASNYMGGEVAALIVDDKISDQDYADWAALTLITRQRDPGPSADITHPIIPFLDPRDPITVGDQNFSSITASTLVWVTRISETYTPGTSESRISTTAYPQLSSYEPRQDLDVATIDSVFFGQPAINLSVVYPSIDSGTVTNPGPNLTNAKLWGYLGSGISYVQKEERLVNYSSDTQGTFINMSGTAVWPPIPDSITLGPDSIRNEDFYKIYRTQFYRTLRNNPYMKFTHVFDYNTKKIYLPCQAGDGQAQYQLGGWYIGTSAHLAYLGLDSSLVPTTVYSGRAPFYDPYISELPDGNFINITFDALISGYYRVSVWDARNRNSPTLIAWLTEPSEERPEPESHWSYMTAGRNKRFIWDGVDSVGDWNKKQSQDYAWIARGWFEKDQKPDIGKGFYVWNDNTSPLVAISGQMLGGKLVFNPDNFSQFYIKVEVFNDAFAAAAEQSPTMGGFTKNSSRGYIRFPTGISDTADSYGSTFVKTNTAVRIVDSTDLKGVSQGQNALPSIYIYTHLPSPTKATIASIEDWSPSVKSYDSANDAYGTTGWVTLNSGIGDYGATFRNDKPVRISFSPVARPGGRFSGNSQFTTFKVHRVVHLNANLLDIFQIFEGEPWHALTPVERKRIVTRRLTNAKNTIDYADTDYRTGDSLTRSQNKWIFKPSDFKIDVDGQNQPIEYCNYLQLEDVPGFVQTRTLGESKSRFILAYMNYIFYMSAYIQDRSGRFTWMIDPTDVDYSKILYNTFRVDFPEDMENYSTRTLIARQWNDPNYITSMATAWNIPAGNPTNYVQFFHNRLARTDADGAKVARLDVNGNVVTTALTTGFTDQYSEYHKSKGDFEISGYLTNRQLGDWSAGTTTNFFGDWTWEGDSSATTAANIDPLWIPDLTRDFHPFILCPPMAQHFLIGKPIYSFVTRESTSYGSNPDQAAWETWFSPTYPISNTGVYSNSRPHRSFRSGHKAEEDMKPTTVPDRDLINYQRQIEHLHWEEYRGFLSTGKFPSRNPLLVLPAGGAYLQNLYAYTSIQRDSRVQFSGDDNHVIAPQEGEYSIRVSDPSNTPFLDGWFEWTFRSKFTWYSSSYFPVNEYGMLQPKYLYPKYSVGNWGGAVAYDAGAWVGWKDDLSSSSTLVWKDGMWAGDKNALRNIGSQANNNIFLNTQMMNFWLSGGGLTGERDRPPFALAKKLSVSKDVMISLTLVNSRRSRPITGK